MSNGNGDDPCTNGYTETIQSVINSPRRVSADGIDAQSRSGSEVIQLIRYERALCAEQRGGRGMRGMVRQQMSPPNALGIHLGYGQNVRLRG